MNPELCVEILNLARSMELQAIGQYMQFHYQLADNNFPKLAHAVKKIAIDEMRHAEKLAERIRDLNGLPVSAPAGAVEADANWGIVRQLENDTLADYASYINQLREQGDEVSRKLLSDILMEEQEHFNYFNDIVDSLDKYGDFFLAAQSGSKF